MGRSSYICFPLFCFSRKKREAFCWIRKGKIVAPSAVTKKRAFVSCGRRTMGVGSWLGEEDDRRAQKSGAAFTAPLLANIPFCLNAVVVVEYSVHDIGRVVGYSFQVGQDIDKYHPGFGSTLQLVQPFYMVFAQRDD